MFFEIEDIKRRHSPYMDPYNTHGWVDVPEYTWKWNWLRGAVAGFAGTFVKGMIDVGFDSFKQMRTKYEPPKSLENTFRFVKGMTQTSAVTKVVILNLYSIYAYIFVYMIEYITKKIYIYYFILYKFIMFKGTETCFELFIIVWCI